MSKKHWTPEEVQILERMYPDHLTKEIAKQLGRSEKQVYMKAFGLGLKKSPAYFASEQCGRIRRGKQDPRLIATQFKPGLTPWNKGVKGSTGTQERCKPTQFKPGQKPLNTVPVGSYRIVDSSGIPTLERKCTEVPGPSHKRWVAVSRLVWEEHNGPVPEKHIVVFKDVKHRTTVLDEITIDKLDCISRAEHAKRNHPRSRDPELAKLYQLKGAITRQVNRIAREAKENDSTAHHDTSPATT